MALLLFLHLIQDGYCPCISYDHTWWVIRLCSSAQRMQLDLDLWQLDLDLWQSTAVLKRRAA